MTLYCAPNFCWLGFHGSGMGVPLPQVLSAPHHRCKNLVVVLASAQIARNAVCEFGSRGIGILFQKPDGGHDEPGHAEGALEPLFVDDALLDRVQPAVWAGKSFDRPYFPAPNCMSEDRTRIVGNIVDQHGARAAFGSVTTELGAREAELVTQRPCQRLLFHHVDAAVLAVDIDGDQPIARARLSENVGGAEQVTRGGDRRPAADDTLDEVSAGNPVGNAVKYCVCFLVHDATRIESFGTPLPGPCAIEDRHQTSNVERLSAMPHGRASGGLPDCCGHCMPPARGTTKKNDWFSPGKIPFAHFRPSRVVTVGLQAGIRTSSSEADLTDLRFGHPDRAENPA